MTEAMWVRSHVERLLQDEWDACRVPVDCDGDYHFCGDTAVGWVSVIDIEPTPMVRVWAIAALDIKPTVAMWREVNDIQLNSLSAAVLWSNGRIIVRQTLSPIGLTGPVLTQAFTSVAETADRIGSLFAGMFGGQTPIPQSVPEAEDEDAA